MRRFVSLSVVAATAIFSWSGVNAAEPGRAEQITLLAPGDEPRRLVRLTLDADAESRYSFRADMSVTQRQGQFGRPAMQQPSRLPTIVGAFTERVEADPAGGVSVITEVKEVTLGDPVEGEVAAARDALRAVVPGLAGLKLTRTVTDRGVAAADQEQGADADPKADVYRSFVLAMEQFHCALPAEPIGVGARWTVRRIGEINGVATTWLNTAEVVAMDDISLTLRVEHTHTLVDGKPVPQPGAPPGVEVTTLALDGAGIGTLVYDLRSFTPSRASITVKTSNALNFKSAAGEAKIESDTATEFTLSRD